MHSWCTLCRKGSDRTGGERKTGMGRCAKGCNITHAERRRGWVIFLLLFYIVGWILSLSISLSFFSFFLAFTHTQTHTLTLQTSFAIDINMYRWSYSVCAKIVQVREIDKKMMPRRATTTWLPYSGSTSMNIQLHVSSACSFVLTNANKLGFVAIDSIWSSSLSLLNTHITILDPQSFNVLA